MPFTLPNKADATVAAQASPDKVDFDAIVNGFSNIGVVLGCAVTQRGAGVNMSVDVATGTVVSGTNRPFVSSVNVAVTTAHATLPRFDLVTVNTSGVASVTAGTAAANPVFPAIPASAVILAAVYVGAAVTSIVTANIVDKRVMIVEPVGAAWASFSPSFTGLTIGNGTVVAKFIQMGKTVFGRLAITFGSTTSISAVIDFAPPVSPTAAYAVAQAIGTGTCLDNSASTVYPATIVVLNTTTLRVYVVNAAATIAQYTAPDANVPFTWAVNDVVSVSFAYEAA